jgi:GT2 family glycosyltransferase
MEASIVIPTYNRKEALIETLRRIQYLECPRESWEAIVVDDGSNDGTEMAVQDWLASMPLPIRYMKQINGGPAAARNWGAKEARGKVLIFIDNDIIVAPDFVRLHLAAHRENPGCWILGRITHPEQMRSTPFGRYRDSLWEEFHRARSGDESTETDGMSAANLSLPRADFEKLGGFDSDFSIASSEDWELGFRARQSGIQVLYNPKISVIHNDWAVSLERFCERQRLYSKSDVLLCRKYGSKSPRAELVRVNGPIRWRNDSLALIVKKMIKRVLATTVGRKLVFWGANVMERIAPDTRSCWRVYDLAVALAIFRGVREGWTTYPPAAGREQYVSSVPLKSDLDN